MTIIKIKKKLTKKYFCKLLILLDKKKYVKKKNELVSFLLLPGKQKKGFGNERNINSDRSL